MKGFLLIDGSNIAHAANNNRPLSVGEQPTQAIYGFMRAMRPMIMTYSMLTPIVLWDGMSWRKLVYDEYKKSRDKKPMNAREEAAKVLKDSLKIQIPFIKEGLALLGIRQMHAINYEADDLAGLLIKRYEGQDRKIMMISADKDWVQLVGPGIGWRDPIRDLFITSGNIEKKLGYQPKEGEFQGVPSARAWLEIKALMGDISDDIPGIGGIGEIGAIDFIRKYGSVGAFLNQYTDGAIDPKTLHKKFRDFAMMDEKQDIFRRNMRLMDLKTTERPEAVNLTITSGAFDQVKFEEFCDQFLFRSITSDTAGWCAPFTNEEALAA